MQAMPSRGRAAERRVRGRLGFPGPGPVVGRRRPCRRRPPAVCVKVPTPCVTAAERQPSAQHLPPPPEGQAVTRRVSRRSRLAAGVQIADRTTKPKGPAIFQTQRLGNLSRHQTGANSHPPTPAVGSVRAYRSTSTIRSLTAVIRHNRQVPGLMRKADSSKAWCRALHDRHGRIAVRPEPRSELRRHTREHCIGNDRLGCLQRRLKQPNPPGGAGIVLGHAGPFLVCALAMRCVHHVAPPPKRAPPERVQARGRRKKSASTHPRPGGRTRLPAFHRQGA